MITHHTKGRVDVGSGMSRVIQGSALRPLPFILVMAGTNQQKKEHNRSAEEDYVRR